MHFTTSSVLAAALLAASTSAAPTSPPSFCQEYSLTDGVPCTTADSGKTFQCADDLVSADVEIAAGRIQLKSNNGNQAGVKVTCGASNSTYFVDENSITLFSQAACDGTVPASVITVRSAKQLQLPGIGQQLDFTDGTPCTQEANGSFLCGDSQGATISEAQGNVTMVAGQADAAIKVSCEAGSSIYFCSGPGGSANFTEPTCAAGFKSAISVKSAAPILRNFG
ncbi:hypothetical protein LZ31DRAFT_560438 [Colletotrichum somersetense]|nr:hypothetical protein LZ31DRAFT_560438 [Colletotrichum somersetense]